MSHSAEPEGLSGRTARRVVVTGGAGFVGSHLCRALLDAGDSVVCVDNLSTGRLRNVTDLLNHPGFTFIDADIIEPFPVSGPVDLVLHLACPASPVDYFRMPVATLRAGGHGTFNALCLAREKGARIVITSTSEVYGDPLEHPQREEYWGNVNPVGPRACYDESKRFSEALAVAFRDEYQVDIGIARLFNSYGPDMRDDDGRVVPTFIKQALAGTPLTVMGDGSQTRSLCYVSDTVRGILALAASSESTPVNIGNPHEITMRELAGHVLGLTGSVSPVQYVEAHPDDPQRRRPDISKARRVLGWEPRVPLFDGLKETIESFALAGDLSAA
ncbi:UDP-glucuronic acid decarboxylase family protein [Streptomyces sp. NPDC002932]|uniref:UDP-glucuronic acid decarboxylase family protein n=1 Tax=Streptomyces sp. NPDC002932 TaxID=3364672 RepID=UPI00369D8576